MACSILLDNHINLRGGLEVDLRHEKNVEKIRKNITDFVWKLMGETVLKVACRSTVSGHPYAVRKSK